MAIATDPGGYEQNAVNYCLYGWLFGAHSSQHKSSQKAIDYSGYVRRNVLKAFSTLPMSQNKTIQMVWGTPKGGSDRYKQAKDRFDFYKSQWEKSYCVH